MEKYIQKKLSGGAYSFKGNEANHQFRIHSDFLLMKMEILWMNMLHVSHEKKSLLLLAIKLVLQTST